MRKLKLDLTNLEVTSFDTDLESTGRGTVAGHKTAPPSMPGDSYCGDTCNGGYTCEYLSCAGTCNTCRGEVCYTISCQQTACCFPAEA